LPATAPPIGAGAHPLEAGPARFGIESADSHNAIFLTGRLHFDVGSYYDYQPGSHFAAVQNLNRRQRPARAAWCYRPVHAIERHIQQLEGELQALKRELGATRQQLREARRETAQARKQAQQATPAVPAPPPALAAGPSAEVAAVPPPAAPGQPRADGPGGPQVKSGASYRRIPPFAWLPPCHCNRGGRPKD
jgi:hypothetical protein